MATESKFIQSKFYNMRNSVYVHEMSHCIYENSIYEKFF